MTSWLHSLQHLPAPLVLAVVGALVFGEAAVFLGFVFPGETAVLLAGFMASTGQLSVVALGIVVVTAAILGDTVGYEVGRRFGPRLLETRLLRRHGGSVERARRFLDGRGAPAVFVGRFTAFLRVLTPGMAGLSGMRYRRFLVYNVAGGLVWGIGCVVAGYLAGSSYESVSRHLGEAGGLAAALFVVVAFVVWRIGRRWSRSHGEPDGDTVVASRETAGHGR